MSQVAISESLPDGFSWIAHPDESMQRASHAIPGASGLWLVDPVDGPGLREILDEREQIAGVVVTLDRHTRDSVSLARTFDVDVAVAQPLAGLRSELDAHTSDIEAFCVDTGWEWHVVYDTIGWHEIALSGPDVVLVSETLGTAAQFCAPGERLGVHPVARWLPPRGRLGRLKADRVLVGHGEPVLSGGVSAMTAALRDARRNAPRAYWQALQSLR